MAKPLILVTNDDGIFAPGIRKLISIAREIGEVLVVAPDQPRSGESHAVSVQKPLQIKLLHEEEGYREYSCSGTPVDAVKFGELVILKHMPDIVISGINHGSNASVNVVYSGTMAAAIEAAIDGIPSIGFSLTDYAADADFSAVDEYVKLIIQDVLQNGLEKGTCLNVNIPAIPKEKIKGIKICKQARGKWKEFLELRETEAHGKHYWLTGVFEDGDLRPDTDSWALAHNYIAVVPIHFDLTAHHTLTDLQKRFKHV